MRPLKLSRRALLRGAGGIAVGLPFLEIMADSRSANAQSTPVPQRFVVFFSPNGSIREAWTPSGSETDFQLSRILAPLDTYKQKLVVMDGVRDDGARNGPGDDHMRGMGFMLTGVNLMPGTTQGGCCEPAGLGGGITIDQKIANAIGTSTKFKSIEFGVQAKSSGTVWGYTSYADAGQALPPENNPEAIYTRIFGEVGQDQATAQRLLAERKSVLDAVMGSYSSLAPKLGATDKQKIDQHFTQIRDLENRLIKPGAVGASCVKPVQPAGFDYRSNDQFPATGKLQMDLAVMALACDLTRVATLHFSISVGGTRFTWLGISDRGHHDLSHDGDDNLDTVEKLTQINVWYSEQLFYLMDALAKIPEGPAGETMLDHTLILWHNELGRGNGHTHTGLPLLLAGGAAAAPQPLKMGRFLQFSNSAGQNSDLMVSLLNIFGLPDQTFGSYSNGPLPGLV